MFCRIFLLWSCCAAVASGAGALTEPGPLLVPGENDAGWRPLIHTLREKGAVEASFTERRWFPFRTEPIVLEGEMRVSPERGLSLHYLEPESRTMIVDEDGILLRDRRGRSRAVPLDSRGSATGAVLLPVLRFDLVELNRNFEIHAAREERDWRFDFVPRDEKLIRSLGRLIVTGSGDDVRRLEFRRSSNQRIEILIGEARTGVAFSDDELRQFFR